MQTCPYCGSHKIIMFTSDDDLCEKCEKWFPALAEDPKPRIWVGRNKSLFVGKVDIYSDKPIYQDGVFWGKGNTWICQIFLKDFKKIFNFTLRKGSCKQYEIDLKEVKK